MSTVVERRTQLEALEEAQKIDLHEVVRSIGKNARPVAYDPTSSRYVDDMEYADAVDYYLIDELGDRNYENSRYYDDEGNLFDINDPAASAAADAASFIRRIDRRARRANPRLNPQTPPMSDMGE